LSAVSQESSGQILLKYTAPADGSESPRLPDLGNGVRGGKSAYWVTVAKEESWTVKLLDVLGELANK
jgi:hypothetical protein